MSNRKKKKNNVEFSRISNIYMLGTKFLKKSRKMSNRKKVKSQRKFKLMQKFSSLIGFKIFTKKWSTALLWVRLGLTGAPIKKKNTMGWIVLQFTLHSI